MRRAGVKKQTVAPQTVERPTATLTATPEYSLHSAQPQAVARALASIPHSRATVGQMTAEEQLKLVQQFVSMRTLAPRAAVELARTLQLAHEARTAKAS